MPTSSSAPAGCSITPWASRTRRASSTRSLSCAVARRSTPRHPDAAADAYERALGAAGSDRERCGALIGLGVAHRQRSDYEAMLSAVARATRARDGVRLAARAREAPLLARKRLLRARAARGRLAGARGGATARRARGRRRVEGARLSGIGDAHYALGQMTLAEMHFEQAALCCEAHGFERFATPNRLMISMINLLRGDTRKAADGRGPFARFGRGSVRSECGHHVASPVRDGAPPQRRVRARASRSRAFARRCARSGSRRFDAESLALAGDRASADSGERPRRWARPKPPWRAPARRASRSRGRSRSVRSRRCATTRSSRAVLWTKATRSCGRAPSLTTASGSACWR